MSNKIVTGERNRMKTFIYIQEDYCYYRQTDATYRSIENTYLHTYTIGDIMNNTSMAIRGK